MATMNISLPDELKGFVDSHVKAQAYGTSSEYVRELIRKDRDRQQFRAFIMKGVNSPTEVLASDYSRQLRQRMHTQQANKMPMAA